LRVADASQRVGAKIVDLDPQQQLVSQIWGLSVRVTDGGRDYLAGSFATASFADIWWKRAQGGGATGDIGASSFYQSIISDVVWGSGLTSRFLDELRPASPMQISIKFNLDGYNMDRTSKDFTLGRIVGTIGPSSMGEPDHFILGRHL